MVDCDPKPDRRLVLKIADTQEELEGCFRLLHDAYVAAGFMTPHPSGMRVTPYHSLPTTTTLCAKIDGRVVGTLSLVRDGVFGFPMQSAFNLSSVRSKVGQIAEISALAIHPSCRDTGGQVLFPLMKFMYAYCTKYFDTRHLVIAVNPDKIELYESLLFFDRLPARVVDHYDFANGAPAVGAALDLHHALKEFQLAYGTKPQRRNLYSYFVEVRLENIQLPARPYHTTNDPVLTPALIDHFFNRCTRVFDSLDDRRKALVRSIYDLPGYEQVMPDVSGLDRIALRRHPRFSVRCPALFKPSLGHGGLAVDLTLVELSRHGFRAEVVNSLGIGVAGSVRIELGAGRQSQLKVHTVRTTTSGTLQYLSCRVDAPDEAWLQCVLALERSQTRADLIALTGKADGQSERAAERGDQIVVAALMLGQTWSSSDY